MRNKTNHTPLTRGSRLTDATLLLIITICVFAVMYVCAVLFLGSGFKKPQTFFNILNENAALLILSCGMSLVMITGGIDISVGTLTALVCMSCAVHLDYQGGTVLTAVLLALGIGTAFGPVLGAIALHVFGEVAKAVAGGIPGIDLVLYGLLIVAAIAFAPDGLMGLLKRLVRRKAQETP